MMDWLNTGFYRDFGYGLVYPQIFPNMRRRSDEAQAATLEAAKEKSKFWLGVLDKRLADPGHKYLCGDEITIADYLGAGMLSLSDVICCNLSAFPNVARWLDTMKARPNWAKVNEVYYGMVGAYKGKTFETV
jgi:glutathione S-transferase